MTTQELNDIETVVLDILYRAKKDGLAYVHRHEILYSPSIPQSLAVKMTWALLTIKNDYIKIENHHEFSITQAGIDYYNLRFGHGTKMPEPTNIATDVICLPDLSKVVQ